MNRTLAVRDTLTGFGWRPYFQDESKASVPIEAVIGLPFEQLKAPSSITRASVSILREIAVQPAIGLWTYLHCRHWEKKRRKIMLVGFLGMCCALVVFSAAVCLQREHEHVTAVITALGLHAVATIATRLPQ